MTKPATVYVIRHRATGREYIGITTRDVRARWYEHGERRSTSYISSAIRKYGRPAFDFEVVAGLPCVRLACLVESALIRRRRAHFNITGGGDWRAGPRKPRTPAHSAAISAAKLGHKMSDETRKRMSVAHTGTKLPPEVREKIAASNRRRTLSAETRAKIAASVSALGGRPHTVESRAKISAAQANRPPITEETRERIRQGALNRKRRT